MDPKAKVDSLRQTFDSVLRCPNVRACIDHPERAHPCQRIVNSQRDGDGELAYKNFQLPEPWCGQIDRAPILFVSSNPSIGNDERATGEISNIDAFDSHHYAFGGGRLTHTVEGVYTVDQHGQRSRRPVKYWLNARDRAQELIPSRAVIPGLDYAMTEIVRCKSKNEVGVIQAMHECSSRHFEQTIGIAAARVILAVGKGRGLIRTLYGISESTTLGQIEVSGSKRLVAFLPHPSGWERGPRTLAGLYSAEILQQLQYAVAAYLSDI